jgi:hypothetical protein
MVRGVIEYVYFQKIKEAINNCPRLFFLNDYSPIHLYPDASDEGIGAYLAQRVGIKKDRSDS